ncbi:MULTISPECIES: hypothetical protein [unclassified Mesorhizobium]|uniref:hypothetical protein n=1 Tax=unclassified Mesorhizobium TaxID=325217 RepID=UPI001091B392|nr:MULTISPECIES: hypothetical protein [unclassified Mesorhizobium]TGS97475.1 hypothetical protein EN821_09785 [Mesorhizobium sp. M2D.F.Ca.ET.178.01.1.1]
MSASASTWNRAHRTPSAWRVAALTHGLDKEIALLLDRFLPKVSMRSRALCHIEIIDLMQKAALK